MRRKALVRRLVGDRSRSGGFAPQDPRTDLRTNSFAKEAEQMFNIYSSNEYECLLQEPTDLYNGSQPKNLFPYWAYDRIPARPTRY